LPRKSAHKKIRTFFYKKLKHSLPLQKKLKKNKNIKKKQAILFFKPFLFYSLATSFRKRINNKAFKASKANASRLQTLSLRTKRAVLHRFSQLPRYQKNKFYFANSKQWANVPSHHVKANMKVKKFNNSFPYSRPFKPNHNNLKTASNNYTASQVNDTFRSPPTQKKKNTYVKQKQLDQGRIANFKHPNNIFKTVKTQNNYYKHQYKKVYAPTNTSLTGTSSLNIHNTVKNKRVFDSNVSKKVALEKNNKQHFSTLKNKVTHNFYKQPSTNIFNTTVNKNNRLKNAQSFARIPLAHPNYKANTRTYTHTQPFKKKRYSRTRTRRYKIRKVKRSRRKKIRVFIKKIHIRNTRKLRFFIFKLFTYAQYYFLKKKRIWQLLKQRYISFNKKKLFNNILFILCPQKTIRYKQTSSFFSRKLKQKKYIKFVFNIKTNKAYYSFVNSLQLLINNFLYYIFYIKKEPSTHISNVRVLFPRASTYSLYFFNSYFSNASCIFYCLTKYFVRNSIFIQKSLMNNCLKTFGKKQNTFLKKWHHSQLEQKTFFFWKKKKFFVPIENDAIFLRTYSASSQKF